MLVRLNQLIQKLGVLPLQPTSNLSVLTLNLFDSGCGKDDRVSHNGTDVNL